MSRVLIFLLASTLPMSAAPIVLGAPSFLGSSSISVPANPSNVPSGPYSDLDQFDYTYSVLAHGGTGYAVILFNATASTQSINSLTSSEYMNSYATLSSFGFSSVPGVNYQGSISASGQLYLVVPFDTPTTVKFTGYTSASYNFSAFPPGAQAQLDGTSISASIRVGEFSLRSADGSPIADNSTALFTFIYTPEPSSLLLLGIGMSGLFALRASRERYFVRLSAKP